MASQAQLWSRAAANYEQDFIDPYRDDVANPLLPALRRARPTAKVVADLGCGTGPLLPFLAEHFETVHAVDFADDMLRRARERCAGLDNVLFHKAAMSDLSALERKLDLAVAVNSLVMPDVGELETCLCQIHHALRPGGRLLAVVPAMDAVHYYTMLLVDRALAAGKPLAAARKNAAHLAEHELYDFAFGQFYYKGLEQHFWQPFEIPYRLGRAGFADVRLEKVHLSWDQFAGARELRHEPPPWDWFVQASRPA